VGYLSASLHTGKLRGKIGRGITVQTNDPNKPKVHLTIRAHIVTSVVLLPHEQLAIINTDKRRDRSRLLIRKDPSESGDLKITDLSVTADWLAVKVRQLEEPLPAAGGVPAGLPGDWLLDIALNGPARYGRHRNERVTFKTGLERQPEVVVPVVVDLRPPVNLSSDKVVLPQPVDGEPSTATVLVSLRRGLAASDLLVDAEPDSLSVELEQSGGRFYKAHVRWSDGAPGNGELVFKVGEEQYRVPVTPAPPVPPAQ
jgi:hypothetical protein